MKYITLISACCLLLPAHSHGLQAIGDAQMAEVSGQAGITIETSNTAADGTVLTVGSFVFTEFDEDGLGDESITLNDIRLQIVELNPDGSVFGPGGFTTTIDVLASGELSMKTTDISALNLNVGDVLVGSRSIGAVGLNNWVFGDGSFVETAFVPDIDGVKIRSRTVMTPGSGIDFSYTEDDLTLASDIVFNPSSTSSAFQSEFFISAVDGTLRLEFGQTEGTLEMNDIRILDDAGNPLFGGATFGDIGFGDVTVNEGYFTLQANPDAEGLKGKFASDMTIGTQFYRTNDKRLNLGDVRISTGRNADNSIKEVGYTFEIVGGTGLYGNGIAASFFDVEDLSFTVGSLTFSNGDGSSETGSLGSYGIENFSLNGGSMTASVWALPGAGRQGIRSDVQLSDGASFDLAIFDETPTGSNDPKLTASIVVNDFSQEAHIDVTEKGLQVSVVDMEMSASMNALRVGDGQNYQGQSGRLVIDSLTVEPGAYLRVEPIQIP